MFTRYVADVMSRLARYERIGKERTYFGSIKGFRGVWAEGKTKKECEAELREVLEEWLLLKIRKRQFVPTTRQYDLNTLLSA
ncbi:MAG: type II toxin-antitoxin system HicB family antitoxin [Patescibacteria group bacterium]